MKTKYENKGKQYKSIFSFLCGMLNFLILFFFLSLPYSFKRVRREILEREIGREIGRGKRRI